jgi:hypothetical protein
MFPSPLRERILIIVLTEALAFTVGIAKCLAVQIKLELAERIWIQSGFSGQAVGNIGKSSGRLGFLGEDRSGVFKAQR